MIKTLLATMTIAAVLVVAGCDPQGAPAQELPPLPADIVACLKASGVDIPKRALTVQDVERLWKTDRLRIVVMRNCGARAIAWYSDLRARWK